MTEDRAHRLMSLMSHPAWPELLAVKAEQEACNMDYLKTALTKPDTLTSKTAIAKANRIKGVNDLFDEVERAHKVLAPNRSRAGSL